MNAGAVRTPVLEIAYHEAGARDGVPVVLLHGFPYSVHAYDEAAPALAQAGCRVIVPHLRGHGPTRFLDQGTTRSGQQAALGADVRDLLDGLEIERAVLAGYDWGGRGACIAAALWPERVRGLVSIGGYNIQDIAGSTAPGPAEQEWRWWYQYYFHTPRGEAGLKRNRREIGRLLWKLWSPTWHFDEAAFARTAALFDNPDWADVVIHSYRHRFGCAPGDPALEPIEQALAARPAIPVPSIVLEGAEDGVGPPSDDPAELRLFTQLRRRTVVDGVGHNLPQEKPDRLVRAVLELA